MSRHVRSAQHVSSACGHSRVLCNPDTPVCSARHKGALSMERTPVCPYLCMRALALLRIINHTTQLHAHKHTRHSPHGLTYQRNLMRTVFVHMCWAERDGARDHQAARASRPLVISVKAATNPCRARVFMRAVCEAAGRRAPANIMKFRDLGETTCKVHVTTRKMQCGDGAYNGSASASRCSFALTILTLHLCGPRVSFV